MTFHLVADFLDEQLVDRKGEPAGRVDGIVIELREDRPPRVVCVEASPITVLASCITFRARGTEAIRIRLVGI